MSDNPSQTWKDVRRVVDELELKIHLASMEARDRWNELRPRLDEIEASIERTGKRAGEAISDQLEAFAKAIRQLGEKVTNELDSKHPSP